MLIAKSRLRKSYCFVVVMRVALFDRNVIWLIKGLLATRLCVALYLCL